MKNLRKILGGPSWLSLALSATFWHFLALSSDPWYFSARPGTFWLSGSRLSLAAGSPLAVGSLWQLFEKPQEKVNKKPEENPFRVHF